MIGKIMSEVSHSIIGMLSAKPVDMETRASNPDFMALLTSSDEQYRLAPDAGSPEAPDQENSDRFLEQLVGIENQTSSAPNAAQTVSTEILKNSFGPGGEPSGSLTSEALSPSEEMGLTSASAESEIASDSGKTHLGHIGTIASAGGISAGVIGSSSHGRSAETHPSFTNGKGATPLFETMPNRLPDSAAQQSSVASLVSPAISSRLDGEMTPNQVADAIVRPSVSNESIVSKAELMGRATVDVERKVSSSNARPALAPTDILQTSADVSKPNFVPALPTDAQNSAVRPKILDSIDLRLASKAEAKGSSIPSTQEIEFPNVLAGGDKRGIADIKNALVGADTAASLETLVRDVPSSNPPNQSATHKTVNFDWNAPNFAGRFAAEVSGMTTIGDSKKFEINPRNLGRLEVAFVSRGAAEFIRIEAETDAARDVILQNAQAIQDMLKAQGRSDLTIRVDVKESGFSSLNGGDLNQAQQDSAGTNESGENVFSKNSQNGVREAGIDAEFEPEASSDSSRYA